MPSCLLEAEGRQEGMQDYMRQVRDSEARRLGVSSSLHLRLAWELGVPPEQIPAYHGLPLSLFQPGFAYVST
eukprot:13916728-Alexandrium_andersonii.AAC.1